MPARTQPKTELQNNFIKGLITENTALQFPQDACTETFNCVFDITGRVTRRLGADIETSGQFKGISASGGQAFTEFVWTSVGGVGSRVFLVQQVGQFIYFFDQTNSDQAIPNVLSFSIDLSTSSYKPSLTTPFAAADFPCQYASGRGDLVIVNYALKPLLVKYDAGGNSIAVTPLDLLARDFTGLGDGLSLTERPAIKPTNLPGSNPGHLYNLINQGWYVGGGVNTGFADANNILKQWDTARTDSPANADIPSLYRNKSVGLSDPFDTASVDGLSTGNTQAPKGHFILNVFDKDRQGAMTAGGYTVTLAADAARTVKRPTTAVFYAGRVFYAGVDELLHSSSIYFTQIIERDEQYGQCYQKNDPTNEHFTDLLPDDGGTIKIPDAGLIVRLFIFNASLIVLATNGVWLISGSTQSAFQANDFQVRKVSSIGTNSPLSVVDARGVPFWWTEEGIYTLTFDPSYPDTFSADSITTTTIQSFFDSIPAAERVKVKGVYNAKDRVIFWLFNSVPVSTISYDSILCYNTISKAFYPWTIPGGELLGFFHKIRGVSYLPSPTQALKFTLVREKLGVCDLLSYADIRNLTYKDWVTLGATRDFLSYFVTGYSFDGETQRFFQPGYVLVFLEEEDNASCFMRGTFDFATEPSTGKFSSKQQLYNVNLLNRSVRYRKLKVRGKGKALQMLFESESGKPFTIIGWSRWSSQSTTA